MGLLLKCEHVGFGYENQDAAKRYELGELRTVMEEGAQLEQNVKTGLMTDTLAVELFIVKNSGKQ